MTDHPADTMPAMMFQAALDAMPQPVLIYDNSQILYVNEAAGTVLGCTDPTSLLGMSVDTFVFPDLADVIGARREYVMGSGVELRNLNVKIRGLDGEAMVLHIDVVPLSFDGSVAAMATLAHPTLSDARSAFASGSRVRPSEYRAAERERVLAAGTTSAKEPAGLAMFEAALAGLETAILIHGPSVILFANTAACKALRASDSAEVIGLDLTSIVHPDGRDAGRDRRDLVLGRNQALQDVPVKLMALDGTTLYARVNARRIAWADETAILIAATSLSA